MFFSLTNNFQVDNKPAKRETIMQYSENEPPNDIGLVVDLSCINFFLSNLGPGTKCKLIELADQSEVVHLGD